MQKIIKMYYDSFEKDHGDGFYPLMVKEIGCNTEIDILFEYYDDELTQLSGPPIKGYDGDTINLIINEFYKV